MQNAQIAIDTDNTILNAARKRIIGEGRRRFLIEEAQKQIGDVVTVQLGNPGDTDWKPATHANVKCEIIAVQFNEIVGRTQYLVRKVDDHEYLASAMTNREHALEYGDYYSTNARTFGKSAKEWTGILTMLDAARSLGFNAYVEACLKDPNNPEMVSG